MNYKFGSFKNLKVQLCRTLLELTEIYVCKARILQKSEERKLQIFERKIVIQIYSLCFDGNTDQ